MEYSVIRDYTLIELSLSKARITQVAKDKMANPLAHAAMVHFLIIEKDKAGGYVLLELLETWSIV